MRWLAQLRMRIEMLFGRGRAGARLDEELPGYPDYCLRTRYRLIPFVW